MIIKWHPSIHLLIFTFKKLCEQNFSLLLSYLSSIHFVAVFFLKPLLSFEITENPFLEKKKVSVLIYTMIQHIFPFFVCNIDHYTPYAFITILEDTLKTLLFRNQFILHKFFSITYISILRTLKFMQIQKKYSCSYIDQ